MLEVDIPKEMILKYVERRATDLVSLEQSLASGDVEKIKQIAHQIKGNAMSFGFGDLSEIVIQLEQAALSNNQPLMTSMVEKFKSWVAAAS